MAIWHIGTANKMLAEKDATIASLTERLTKAESAIAENESEAIKAAAQLESDLVTAKQSISTLTGERDAALIASAASVKQIADLQAQVAAKDTEVKAKAAQQVQSIQAALGQPPVPAVPQDAKEGANAKPLFGLDRVIAAEKAARNARK